MENTMKTNCKTPIKNNGITFTQTERVQLNVYYKECTGTYNQWLDKMLEDGKVSMRGLKPDAKVFGELVFDVNTMYFENHGGYEFAKKFYEEAFHYAKRKSGATTSSLPSCTLMKFTGVSSMIQDRKSITIISM